MLKATRRAHGRRERLLAGPARAGAEVGADVVLDPAQDDPFDTDPRHKHLKSAPEVFDLAVGAMEKLQRIPLVPWHRVWQAAEAVGRPRRRRTRSSSSASACPAWSTR